MEEKIVSKFIEWLHEDDPYWDITTEALIPNNIVVKSAIIAKREGIVACIDEARLILEKLGFRIEFSVNEGSNVEPGDHILVFVGNAKKTLVIERTLLNLLMHCSGVATLAKVFVDKVREINPKVRVAITRKTLPGLRYFEKKAAWIAGCDTHRFGLSDSILIKDNHLAIIGSVREAIEQARSKSSFTKRIEIEVNNVEDAVEAVEAGADIVLLDNFKPEDVGLLIGILREKGLRDRVLIEVSGGVGLDNIAEYVKYDIDVVSVGAITHSAPALDMSLEILEVIK
uniref:Nicotinate-nucleotide pyrophosphorylase [carboxylating] n=1 Tax=Staphylothermus marinus TaxID=2280 RepID=A0A7C4D736_STAMA